MPRESIVFDPEIDERQLDSEVDQVNEQLDDAASDIQTDIESDMDALSVDGLAGGGGGGAVGGAGQAAGIGALASKIPKPVAGVTAAAALPIALTGGVGVGLLNEMKSASARMQTSASILGMAWNNIWRPIGDKIDELFIRDAVMGIMNATQSFEEAFRAGDWLIDPLLKGMADVWRMDFGEATFDFAQIFMNAADQVNWDQIIPGFPGWPAVGEMWPGWPDIGGMWPGWPDVGGLWPGWPNITGAWPGWPNVTGSWPGWPTIGTPDWPSAGQILDQFPELSVTALRDAILEEFGGNGDGGDGPNAGDGGDNGGNGFWPGPIGPLIPPLQSGGRVERTGVAEVHRGEIVSDPDRLVSELADAINTQTGGTRGRSGSVDTAAVETKLDQLHGDLRRLESALDVTVSVGREEIGRAVSDGKRNRVTDTDPTV